MLIYIYIGKIGKRYISHIERLRKNTNMRRRNHFEELFNVVVQTCELFVDSEIP